MRKLFCEISPLTYKLSVFKCRLIRHIKNIRSSEPFAKEKSNDYLPIVIYSQKSLIRRKLGNVDLQLQENKAINLSLSAPKVNGVIIKPGETFSFWKLVGNYTARKGYKTGLVISKGMPSSGMGGGMCQFTNLIHWLVLHTPLEIVEHHHHDGLDLFPDYGRQIPFGTGTSIVYNYLDYRFKNNTDMKFQLIVHTDGKYLIGEIRAENPLDVSYHIGVENEAFVKRDNSFYRVGTVYREIIDKKTGNVLSRDLIKENNAKVMYELSQ